MPVLSKFYGIFIRMLFTPRLSAHFHALHENWELVVGISPVRVINGDAPEWVHRLVLEWASLHQGELMDNWWRCGAAKGPHAIAPLA
jgi:hypothetical protein